MLDTRPDSVDEAITELLRPCLGSVRDLYEPDHDADEWEQVLRIAIWRAWVTFTPGVGRFAPFVMMCARRAAITHVRMGRGRRRTMHRLAIDQRGWNPTLNPDGMQPIELVLGDNDPADVAVLHEDLAEAVDLVANSCTPLERSCVIALLSGETYVQASLRLGITYKQMDNALGRVRRKARAMRVVSSAA